MARKKNARRADPVPKILFVSVMVALLAAAFALGWHFGVESTRFKGNILLVNASHTLPPDYVPEGLVNLYEQRHSFRLARSDIQLTRETYEAAEKMFHAAEEQGMNGFYITSGYRSYERQKEVYAESEPGKAQTPGASEHQTGLAFDVTAESSSGNFESTQQYAWLSAHGLAPAGAAEPEPPVSSSYELPALEGLAALLERIYLEYDPTAAGTVVSVRWTRSLLDWYAAAGQDPEAAREAAALFARRYVVTGGFLGSLNRLRAAGEQLVTGQLGLVRDFRFADFDAGTVDELFRAIQAGLEEA